MMQLWCVQLCPPPCSARRPPAAGPVLPFHAVCHGVSLVVLSWPTRVLGASAEGTLACLPSAAFSHLQSPPPFVHVQVRSVPLLCRHGCHHDCVRVLPCARDQGCAARGGEKPHCLLRHGCSLRHACLFKCPRSLSSPPATAATSHFSLCSTPPGPLPQQIYTLYCKHPVWRKVLGEQEVQAMMELEATNSGSIRMSRQCSALEAAHSGPTASDSSPTTDKSGDVLKMEPL